MAGDDDVTIKIAGDVKAILDALEKMSASFTMVTEGVKKFATAADSDLTRVTQLLSAQLLQQQKWGEITNANLERLSGGMKTTTKDLLEATTLGSFFGEQLNKAFEFVTDGIKEVVTALPEMVARTAEAGDRFLTMSQQTGISVRALSEFDFIASQTGTSVQTITSAVFKMSRGLGEGTKSSRDAIKALGLSFKDLQTSAPEDAFDKIIGSIDKLPSSAQKAQVGMDLFGRQFKSIAQLTTEDMKKLREEAEELGLGMSKAAAQMGDKFNDAIDKFHRVSEGFSRQIGLALMPAMTKLVEGVTGILKDFLSKLGIDFDSWGDTASDAVDKILVSLQKFADALLPLARLVVQFVQEGLVYIPPAIDKITTAIQYLVPLLSHLHDILASIGPVGILAAVAISAVGTSIAEALIKGAMGKGAEAGFLAAIAGPFKSAAGEFSKVLLKWGVSAGAQIVEVLGPVFAPIGQMFKNFASVALEAISAAFPKMIAWFVALDAAALPLSVTLAAVALTIGLVVAAWKLIGENENVQNWFERLYLRITGVDNATIDLLQKMRKLSEAEEKRKEDNAKTAEEERKRWEDEAQKVKELEVRIAAMGKQEGALTATRIAGYAATAKGLQDLGHVVGPLALQMMAINAKNEADAKAPQGAVANKADEEKLFELEAARQKAVIEITKSGIDQKLALQDAENAETMRKLVAANHGEAVLRQQRVVNALAIQKILVENEKTQADEVLKIQQAEYAAILTTEKRGLDLKIAQIANSANAEIETRRAALKGGEKEQKDFDAWRVQRAAQAQIDIGVAEKAALQASQDQLRAAVQNAQTAKIQMEKVGTEQSLALADLETQKQLEAKQKELGDSQAYYVAAAAIVLDGETKKGKIRFDAEKASQDAIIALQNQEAQTTIELSQSGVDKELALENQRYNAKIAQLRKLGTAVPAEYAEEARAHELATKKIIQDDKKVYDSAKVTANARGLLTRQQLEKNVEDAREAYQQIIDAGDEFTDDVRDQAKQQLQDADDALTKRTHLWVDAFTKMGEAVTELGATLESIESIGKNTFTSILSGVGSVLGGLDSMGSSLSQIQKGFSKDAAGDFSFSGIVSGITGVISLATTAIKIGIALWKAFSKSPEQKVAEESLRDFGVKLSDELTKKIVDASKTFEKRGGGRMSAELSFLADIIKEGGGLSGKNVAQFSGHMHDMFSEFDRGVFTVEDLKKSLGETLPIFAEFATKSEAGMLAFTDSTSLMITRVKEGKISAKDAADTMDASFQILTDDAVKNNKVISQSYLNLAKNAKDAGIEMKSTADFQAAMYTKLQSGLKAAVSKIPEVTSAMDTLFKSFSKKEQDQLTADYQRLKDRAKDSKQEFTLTFEEFIAQQGNFYGKLKEGDEQLQTVFYGGDLEKFNAAKEAWQGSFDRLSRISLASFNGMVANGKSAVEAMNEIGDSVDILIDRQDKLGLKGNAAFDELKRFRSLIKDNQELVESVGGLNDVMLALANTGSLTEDTFKDLEDEGSDSFAKLKKAGFTEQEALSQMKPFLMTAIKLQKDRGFAIDDNTQAMIDQAKAQGIISADEESTQDVLKEGLTEIIKALKGDIPAAWATAGKAGVDAAKAAKDAQDKLNASIEGTGKKLDGTDWDQWGADAEEAAGRAKDAVDGVTYGHSPGGIVDVIKHLGVAGDATDEFYKQFTKQMDDAAASAKELSEQNIAPEDLAQGKGMMAKFLTAHPGGVGDATSMMADKMQQLIASMSAASADAANSHVSLVINDQTTYGTEAHVENVILPNLITILRRGRRLRDMQNALEVPT